MMKRYEIINYLIQKYSLQSYLEIGCQYGISFAKIKIGDKTSVDPFFTSDFKMTSNDFFAQNKKKFDIIFIDGLHHANQALRDIINSLKVCNENGFIIVHDCNPATYEMQITPMPDAATQWNGDVWKAWIYAKSMINYTNRVFVVDTDYGCGVIVNKKIKQFAYRNVSDSDYYVFDKNRKADLNLISVEEFLQKL